MHPIHRMHENAHECTLYQMHCNATLKVRMNEGKQMHRTRIAECNLHECALKCKIMRYHAACATMQHALPCKRELYKPQFDTQRKGTTRPQPEGRRN